MTTPCDAPTMSEREVLDAVLDAFGSGIKCTLNIPMARIHMLDDNFVKSSDDDRLPDLVAR